MNRVTIGRTIPVGAEVQPGIGVHFRLWAPACKTIDVVTASGSWPLENEGDGYFSNSIAEIAPGARYKFRIDDGDAFPDPVSRYQPDGPHGWSEVVDPSAFPWTDTAWRGLRLKGQVIYEMHVGTFSPSGDWRGAIEHLPELARIGITVLEIMPVADFTGSFGWGYDGVCWFAPCRLYGTPDDFRSFVDKAHSLGMAVILDVVYNHFGADGNYTGRFSPYYLSKDRKTDWGEALNYDGAFSKPVREFVTSNAAYWIREFHLDGLRLDATQDIFDDSTPHIIADIGRAVREAADGRDTILIAENEPQHPKLVRPIESGGYGLDGLWNDDLHHAAIVALTGRAEAYYTDYRGRAQEFVSAMKYGYLFQGQRYKWQKQRRGRPAFGLDPSVFVTFIQNHDQIANSLRGRRIHELTSPAALRAATAMILLGPGTPMLFQGQEFAASAPFLYFADVPDCLRLLVTSGRTEFLSQFRSLQAPETAGEFIDPCSRETFLRSKLDNSERVTHASVYALHVDLLRLRHTDPVLSNPRHFDGAVLSDEAFCFRYFDDEHGDRLLIVNFGPDLHFDPAPEPLLGPPEHLEWQTLFSTEHPNYGGDGTPRLESDENWRIPGRAAVLLSGAPRQLESQLNPETHPKPDSHLKEDKTT